MSASIARFLKDFGEPEAPAVPTTQAFDSPLTDFPDFSASDIIADAAEPELDLEALHAAAVEEGRALEREELSARYEAEKIELIDAHELLLKADRERLETEIATRLSQNLQQSIEQIVTLFTDQAVAALAPVLTEELSRQAAVDLAALVRQSLLDGEASKLVVKGPRGMFEAFNAELKLEEAQYQFTESEDYDLTVEMGETIVVTRMSAWASSLRKVVQ